MWIVQRLGCAIDGAKSVPPGLGRGGLGLWAPGSKPAYQLPWPTLTSHSVFAKHFCPSSKPSHSSLRPEGQCCLEAQSSSSQLHPQKNLSSGPLVDTGVAPLVRMNCKDTNIDNKRQAINGDIVRLRLTRIISTVQTIDDTTLNCSHCFYVHQPANYLYSSSSAEFKKWKSGVAGGRAVLIFGGIPVSVAFFLGFDTEVMHRTQLHT